MTIAEAMRKASDDYNAEVERAEKDPRYERLMKNQLRREYAEIDQELPGFVAEIAKSMGVPTGTVLPDYVYQTARMVFRFGMRVQRKLDRPDEETTIITPGGRND